MTTAIVIITFVVFVGLIARSAAAIRNWPVAITLAILAIALYVTPFFILDVSGDDAVKRLHARLGVPLVGIACAVMFLIGYGVPALLTRAEKSGRMRLRAAFMAAVFFAVFGVHLWSLVTRLGLYSPYVVPELWFSIGTAWFLVFRARIFEDGGNEPADLDRRRA